MSYHSEEIWESIDVLWRRFEQLSRQVCELEARFGTIESELQASEVIASDKPTKAIYESEVGR